MVDEHEIFPAFAFASFVLVLIPLPWHLQAWNTGTCLYMVWTAIASLNLFINSIIWKDNAINWAPAWCDLSARIYVLINVAIPASSLCINRRLYHIATAKTITVTKATRRRAIISDLSIGVGIPLIQLVFHYFCQGHRFDIFEWIGCFPSTYNTPLAYAFVFTWPLIIGLISAVYACLTIRSFIKRRSQFKELLSCNTDLNATRYFRLMALAGIEVLGTVPLSIWLIYLNLTSAPLFPYKGFVDTHLDFWRVNQYPALLWTNWGLVAKGMRMVRWFVVACGFIFFAFFGFADEARKHYRQAFNSVAKRVFSTGTMGSQPTSSGTEKPYAQMSTQGEAYPSFVRPAYSHKRDSNTSSFRTLERQDSHHSFINPLTGHVTAADVVKSKKDDIGSSSSAASSTTSLPHIPQHALRSPFHERVHDAFSGNTLDEKHTTSLHSASIPQTSVARPDVSLDVKSPPRHIADAPMSAQPSDDIV